MMCHQELNNMIKSSGSGATIGAVGQKKPTPAADPKKKWMRRI